MTGKPANRMTHKKVLQTFRMDDETAAWLEAKSVQHNIAKPELIRRILAHAKWEYEQGRWRP